MCVEIHRRLRASDLVGARGLRPALCGCVLTKGHARRTACCLPPADEARIDAARWEEAAGRVDPRAPDLKVYACQCGLAFAGPDELREHMFTPHAEGVHGPHIGNETWAGTAGAWVAYDSDTREMLAAGAGGLGAMTAACSSSEAEALALTVGAADLNGTGAEGANLTLATDSQTCVDMYRTAVERRMKLRQSNRSCMYGNVTTMSDVAGAVVAPSSLVMAHVQAHTLDKGEGGGTLAELNRAVDIGAKAAVDVRRQLMEPDRRQMVRPDAYGGHSTFTHNSMHISTYVGDIAVETASQTCLSALRQHEGVTARAAEADRDGINCRVATKRALRKMSTRARDTIARMVLGRANGTYAATRHDPAEEVDETNEERAGTKRLCLACGGRATQDHYRWGECAGEENAAIREAVERQSSAALAAVGATFWWCPTSRVSVRKGGVEGVRERLIRATLSDVGSGRVRAPGGGAAGSWVTTEGSVLNMLAHYVGPDAVPGWERGYLAEAERMARRVLLAAEDRATQVHVTRQLPPALLDWSAEFFGMEAQRLATPLTEVSGVFRGAMGVVGGLGLGNGASPGCWAYEVDDLDSDEWSHMPWPGSSVVVVDLDSLSLERTRRMYTKFHATCTAEGGRRVMLCYTGGDRSRGEWRSWAPGGGAEGQGASIFRPIRLAKGSLPVASAAGFRGSEWTVVGGRVRAGAHADLASLPRKGGANGEAGPELRVEVWELALPAAARRALPYSPSRLLERQGGRPVDELAWVLAGCSRRRRQAARHSMWVSDIGRRSLDLQFMPNVWRDPLLPLKQGWWQPVANAAGAGLQECAEDLRALRGRTVPVPDGMVPWALVNVLTAQGLTAEEAREDAANVVAAGAEALVQAERSWSSAWAERVRKLGEPVTLTNVRGERGGRGACMACGRERTVLFYAWGGDFLAPAGRALHQRMVGEWVRSVPAQVAGELGEGALRRSAGTALTKHGAVACHACLVPLICEMRGQLTELGRERREQRTREYIADAARAGQGGGGSCTTTPRRGAPARSTGRGTSGSSSSSGREGERGSVTDPRGSPWVMRYEGMARKERDEYVDEERLRVCGGGGGPMLRPATQEQVRVTNLSPDCELLGSVVSVAGHGHTVAFTAYALTGGGGVEKWAWLRPLTDPDGRGPLVRGKITTRAGGGGAGGGGGGEGGGGEWG